MFQIADFWNRRNIITELRAFRKNWLRIFANRIPTFLTLFDQHLYLRIIKNITELLKEMKRVLFVDIRYIFFIMTEKNKIVFCLQYEF